ncbi:MAG: N-6 DNA methylase [Thiotrichales bacterium]|nr:N-6 DNA methylase [Thiotrichales bacterium]
MRSYISSTKIEDDQILQNIILSLSPLQLSSVDEDIKGVAFEHFIQKTTDTQNDLGEYFTPRHIVRFMVKLLGPEFGKSVYDPFCGTGGFLTESFKHLSHQVGISLDANNVLQKDSVFGGELTTTARIAKMNMILFGDGHSGVNKQDSIKTDTDEQFDYVLSNIPFSQTITHNTLKQFQGLASNGDSACVLRCFNSLKSSGGGGGGGVV